jgi:hypothetical protein
MVRATHQKKIFCQRKVGVVELVSGIVYTGLARQSFQNLNVNIGYYIVFRRQNGAVTEKKDTFKILLH